MFAATGIWYAVLTNFHCESSIEIHSVDLLSTMVKTAFSKPRLNVLLRFFKDQEVSTWEYLKSSRGKAKREESECGNLRDFSKGEELRDLFLYMHLCLYAPPTHSSPSGSACRPLWWKCSPPSQGPVPPGPPPPTSHGRSGGQRPAQTPGW